MSLPPVPKNTHWAKGLPAGGGLHQWLEQVRERIERVAADLPGFVTEAMLEEALSGIGTSGTVTSVNGIGPDSSGNVVIPVSGGGGGGAGLTEDPDHPGLYLINTVQNVTAAAPTFTDQDGTTNDRYTIPAVTGVEYRVNGALRSAGIYTPTAGQSITVIATALAGYTLTGTSTWSYTFSTGTAPVSVTANTPTADDDTDLITWTPKTGVEYVIDGSVRTPPYSVGDVDATVTVTAQAQSGYVLTGTTSWTFEFTKAPTTAFSNYSAEVVTDAPVVFFKLNEASGTPVDTMGTATATLVGAPTLGNAPIIAGATSAQFPAVSDAYTFGTPAALDNMTAGFTVEALAVFSTADGGIVNRSDGNTNMLKFSNGNRALLTTINGGSSVQTPNGTSGVWDWDTPVHVAVTNDGTTTRHYVNGVEVHNAAHAKTVTTTAIPWEIGREDSYQGGRKNARGRLGGIAIYNKVLTPARILAHAQAAGLAA